MKNVNYKYFTSVGVIFVAVLLISNVAAQKLIPVGPFIFTAGVFLFPISYIFGDILTEIYGYKKAKQIIWLGFGASAFMAIFLYVVILLPPAPGWELQEEFSASLSQVPRIVIASLIAYWSGEFSNSLIMSKLKIRTKGKHLWIRTIGSTIVGQGADTIIFVIIAFWGIVPVNILITTIWSGYLFKVIYETLATPFTYMIVNWLKKKEGIDTFDKGVNYNPFRLK